VLFVLRGKTIGHLDGVPASIPEQARGYRAVASPSPRFAVSDMSAGESNEHRARRPITRYTSGMAPRRCW
jgi:hypothetical protein